MLSHIDDDEKNECKYVGAEYHPRVFKAADIAVENLIMNGIIEAMMNLMSKMIDITTNLKSRMKRSWRAAEKLAKAAYNVWVTLD